MWNKIQTIDARPALQMLKKARDIPPIWCDSFTKYMQEQYKQKSQRQRDMAHSTNASYTSK